MPQSGWPTGTVTFLFTDIEKSTQLWERYPVGMKTALARHDTILYDAIHTHEGYIVKTTGDGFLAVFRAVNNAVAAAIAAQRNLANQPEWSSETSQALEPRIRVRMGIHTGETELRDGDYYGTAVNRAARLMSIGHGGQVLLSAVSAALVDGILPVGVAMRDLGEHRLRGLTRPERVMQLMAPELPADFPPLVTQPAADIFEERFLEETRNPYKGLLAFSEADADVFFGRDAMTARLVARLGMHESGARFLAVVGPSGSGKSSLVKAGLISALRQGALPGSAEWSILEIPVGATPLEEVEAALLRHTGVPSLPIADQMRADDRGLLDAARIVLGPKGEPEMVLVFDQFEELFTLVSDQTVVSRFLDNICTAVNDPKSTLRIILTLRADFYDRPLSYPGISELMQKRTEVVVPLSTEELMSAINGPAALVGIIVEPELIAELISEVNRQPGALPLLQSTLDELFERRDGNRLTQAAYARIGGINAVLNSRAEDVYERLGNTEQQATRALFPRLVSLGLGHEVTKRRVLLAELIALDIRPNGDLGPIGDAVEEQPAPVTSVLEAFGRARLLSFDRDRITRGTTVEIAHEALLGAWPRLSAWLEIDRATIRLGRLLTQAATEWLDAGQGDGFLLRGARLDQLAPQAHSGMALTENERLFLEKSLDAREARRAAEAAQRNKELEIARSMGLLEQRRADEQERAASRLRKLAIGLTAALALAGVAALLALNFARASQQNAEVAAQSEVRALTNARLATSRELSQAASNLLTTDPELSMLLALQALENAETKDAQEALHQALQSSRIVSSFPTGATGHFGAIFATSPEGSQVATADGTGVIIWETLTGNIIRKLPLAEPLTDHYQLDYDDLGRRLALVSAGKSMDKLVLHTWDLGSGNALSGVTLPIEPQDSSDVALSPDWQRVAVSFEDGSVVLWDVESQQQYAVWDLHDAAVIDVEFGESGQQLATASRDGMVQVWDVEALMTAATPEPVILIDGSSQAIASGGLVHIAFIGDSGLALGYLGNVDVWYLDDLSRPRFTLQGATKLTRDFAVNHDQTQLGAGGQSGRGEVWALDTGGHLLTLAQHPAPVDDIDFTPDERYLISLDRDGLLRLWDIRPVALGERASLSVDPGVFDLNLSPDGTRIALGNTGGPASVWNLATGERLATLPANFGAVYRVDYSPDGRLLATAASDGLVRIWDLESGEQLTTLSGHGSGLAGGLFPGTLDVAFSPNGTRLVSAGADGLAKIWDVATGEELMTLAGHTDSLHSVAWSPDGRTIATTSDDGDTSVKLWDAQTGDLLHTLLGHVVRVWGLAFSPDSSTLITGGARGIIKAWDVTSGNNLYTVIDEADHIGTVTFAPDGETFATTGEVPLRLRRTANGEEILTLSAPLLWSVQFSPDGRWLYAGDVDGIIRVFAVNLDDAVALTRNRLTRWWRPEECRRYLHSETCPPAPPSLE
jgi:WD40 repeat protein/class 3 adenylate cyclase